MKLTDKQDMFCREYLIDLNATQAAIRAGYSEKTAKVQAARMLSKVNLQNRIQELKAERIERTNTDQDKTIEELKKLAFSDYTELVNYAEGSVIKYKSIEEIPDELKACIESITPTSSGLVIKLHSKVKALDMLMRHEGKYEKDYSQSQPNSIVITIDGSGVPPVTSEDDINEDI